MLIKSPRAASVADCKMIFGAQSQRLIPIITDSMCEVESLSAGLVVMAPLKIAKPHIHHHTESILYFTEGWFATLVGPDLTPMFHGPGDLLFIPEGLVHVGINLSAEFRAVALEVRTDPRFNSDVVVLPEFEKEVESVATRLQRQFAARTLDLPAGWEERGFGPYSFEEKEEHRMIDVTNELEEPKTGVESPL